MRTKLTILLLLATATVAAAGEKPYKHGEKAAEEIAAPKKAALGKPAPGFTLESHKKEDISLSDYAGKIVVLEWVNPQCPYTRRHYKEDVMEDLAAEFAPKGVVWLAINSTYWYGTADNAKWAKEQKLDYPVLTDANGKVGRVYDAKTTPDIRIIDKEGKLVYAGAIDDDPLGKKDEPVNYVRQALLELTQGHAVQTAETKPYGCSLKYANLGDAELGKTAPVFTLKDEQGDEVSLSDFATRYLVIEWVNFDCPFSKRHLKAGTANTLAKKYADKGVDYIMINSTHYANVEKNKAWAKEHGLKAPVLDDNSGDVGRRYHAKTTPDIRIIDRGGRLVYMGAIDDDPRGKKEATNYIEHVLEKLLAGEELETQQTKPYGCSVKYAEKKK